MVEKISFTITKLSELQVLNRLVSMEIKSLYAEQKLGYKIEPEQFAIINIIKGKLEKAINNINNKKIQARLKAYQIKGLATEQEAKEWLEEAKRKGFIKDKT